MRPAKDEREGKPRTAFAKDLLCGKDRTSGYDGADAAAIAADAPTAPVFGNSLSSQKKTLFERSPESADRARINFRG